MTFATFAAFAEAAAQYLELTRRFVDTHNLAGQVTIDHICYKCQSSAEYDAIRAMLEQNPPSTFLFQSILSKRRVAYVSLQSGLPIGDQAVMWVELADKRPVEEKLLGFHHIEMYPLNMSYSDLVAKLQSEGETIVLKERPHHTTHDIVLSGGFIVRLTDVPLIRKIVAERLS